MRWIVVVLGVVALAAVLVVIVGSLLPKAHVATRQAVVNAPLAAVWAAVGSPEHYAQWRPDVTGVELRQTTDGKTAWTERSAHGAVPYVFDEMERPTRLVSRITDAHLPYSGRWIFELAPAPTGTRLTITEEGEVANPVFRFVSYFILGHTSSIDAYLLALQRRFGQAPTPRPQA